MPKLSINRPFVGCLLLCFFCVWGRATILASDSASANSGEAELSDALASVNGVLYRA